MRAITIAFIVTFSIFSGCSPTGGEVDTQSAPSGLTHGNVQLNLHKGQTSQNEVLEAFGPPNIMTYDSSGHEVWTYQRHATISKSKVSGSYGTVILLGGSSQTTGFEQSSRTMTLIIKFDEEKRVSDFRSMTTTF